MLIIPPQFWIEIFKELARTDSMFAMYQEYTKQGVQNSHGLVMKIVRENMRELLKVQTLTPGSFPMYPFWTFRTTWSWNLRNNLIPLSTPNLREYYVGNFLLPLFRSENIILIRNQPNVVGVVLTLLLRGDSLDHLAVCFYIHPQPGWTWRSRKLEKSFWSFPNMMSSQITCSNIEEQVLFRVQKPWRQQYAFVLISCSHLVTWNISLFLEGFFFTRLFPGSLF